MCSFRSTEAPPGASIRRGCGTEPISGTSPGEVAAGAKWGACTCFLAYIWLLNTARSPPSILVHVLVVMFLGCMAGAAVVGRPNRRRVRFLRIGGAF